mgnify:CR=1 FL=1
MAKIIEVPVERKALLTVEEAAAVTGLGMGKLREISSDERCDFVLWNGAKRMFKKDRLIAFLYNSYSI